MLSDRHYMRDAREPDAFPALTWLLCAIAGGFIVENIFLLWFGGAIKEGFIHAVTLSPAGISQGFVWTLLTHGLIHDPDNLLHVCFVLFTVFILGRAVVVDIGPKHLLIVFSTAVIVGGALWLGVNWTRGGLLYGASAGLSALMILFACLRPQQPVALFFVDVGLRAKHIAFALIAFHAAGLVLQEIPGRGSWFAMAHSAQLGGMLVAWVYHRRFYVRAGRWFESDEKPVIELPKWARKTRQSATPAPAFKVDVTPVKDVRAEVDRILDKINSEGFQSLTAEEKLRLDDARDHLSRR